MTAPRILVVEDEPLIALHLREQLTKLGYDVPNAVSTGDHALRRIEESRPDLVLMDINLKGKLDGIATAAEVRRTCSVPIIFLTAYSEEHTLARAAATNPQGYLLKPFSERELHATILITLARCRAERASLAAQERLQQARKLEALRQLAGGVADEVDDLLTTLYGQLEVLGGHAISEPLLAEWIPDAFSEAIEKERLVRRLLEFAGRRKLKPVAVAVNDLLARISGRLRQIMGDAIPVRMLLRADLWHARIDPEQLGEAIANLAENARAAMPNGGTLTIEAQNAVVVHDPMSSGCDAGRYVLLSVIDTGTGMPEDVVERAFEPFFTTRASGGASGLGLSLVFGFVRQSGGHIDIDSKPGSGTIIRIYLPAAIVDDLTTTVEQPSFAETEQPAGDATEAGEGIRLDAKAAGCQSCARTPPRPFSCSGGSATWDLCGTMAERGECGVRVGSDQAWPASLLPDRRAAAPAGRLKLRGLAIGQRRPEVALRSRIIGVGAMAAAEDAAGDWVATDGRGGADDRQLPAAGWL